MTADAAETAETADKIVQVAPEVHVGEDEEGLGSRVGERGQADFFLKCSRRYGKAFRAIVTIVARVEGPDETRQTLPSLPAAVTFRAIEPADAPALRRAFAALSPVSRYRRFQRDLAELSDDMVTYLTHVDGVSHLAWIALHVSPDLKDERIVGVARAIRLTDTGRTDVAEIALTVADDFQRHGLGTRLLEVLADAARRQGIGAFRAEVLASNEPAALALANLVEGTREGELLVYEIPLDTLADDAGAGTDAAEPSVFTRFVRLAASPIGRAFRSLR